MKVTVATLTDKVFTLDVSEDLEIENFKVNLRHMPLFVKQI